MQYVGTARQGKIQNVAYTTAAGAIAAAIGPEVNKVRILVTSDAWVLIGPTGTLATVSTGVYVPAKAAEYFSCTPGQFVSAIQDTASGTLNVMECA